MITMLHYDIKLVPKYYRLVFYKNRHRLLQFNMTNLIELSVELSLIILLYTVDYNVLLIYLDQISCLFRR